jgi:DNA-binding PadR family transcriptional regulator
MSTDARALLPLKPLVFEILRALDAGERHGWSLVRELEAQSDSKILPANFYRTLRGMLADGLIQEVDAPTRERAGAGDALERRRYFALTPLGRDAARLEARRLQQLVADARTQRLLKAGRKS